MWCASDGARVGMPHHGMPIPSTGRPRGARYTYAMGYGVDNSFATIMTYEWLFNAPKVAKYSNPNVQCNGMPCGIPDSYTKFCRRRTGD